MSENEQKLEEFKKQLSDRLDIQALSAVPNVIEQIKQSGYSYEQLTFTMLEQRAIHEYSVQLIISLKIFIGTLQLPVTLQPPVIPTPEGNSEKEPPMVDNVWYFVMIFIAYSYAYYRYRTSSDSYWDWIVYIGCLLIIVIYYVKINAVELPKNGGSDNSESTKLNAVDLSGNGDSDNSESTELNAVDLSGKGDIDNSESTELNAVDLSGNGGSDNSEFTKLNAVDLSEKGDIDNSESTELNAVDLSEKGGSNNSESTELNAVYLSGNGGSDNSEPTTKTPNMSPKVHTILALYDREDKSYYNSIRKHFRTAERTFLNLYGYDIKMKSLKENEANAHRENEMRNALVVCLLMSSDFLNSPLFVDFKTLYNDPRLVVQ